MELVITGRQGKTLYVSGEVIRIEKQGFFGGKRDKTIPIRNITSVEVKEPGAFVGFIQLSIAGGKARDSSFTLSGGAMAAVQDENSVVFADREQYETALRIKEYVESWSAKDAQNPSLVTPGRLSVADEIRKLKALMDEGLITAAEFEQQKKQLLSV